MNIKPLDGGNIPGTGKAAEPVSKMSGETVVAKAEIQDSPDSVMKMLFSELKEVLQIRSKLVESLPIPIKKIVQNIFQNSSGADQVSQGLSVLFKSQKAVSDQLQTVVSLLRNTINLRQIPAIEQQVLPNQALNRPSDQFAGLSVDQLKNAVALVQKLTFFSHDITLLNEMSGSKLLESLPIPIKQLVQNIFQNSSEPDQASQEMSALSKSQKAVNNQLLTVVSLLRDTISLRQTPTAGQRMLSNQEIYRSIEILQNNGSPIAYQLEYLSIDQLKKAVDAVQELALSAQKTAMPNASSSSSTQIFTFALPLFFCDNPRPYPTYVHIYNEDKKTTNAMEKPETWIRLCIDTENIGFVDIAFQLYQTRIEPQVNLRVLFDTTEAANSFLEHISNFRSFFDQLSLKLNDVAVNAIYEAKNE